MSDDLWLHAALHLAEQARGTSAPNPAVGAVLIRDGLLVGEGYTQPVGGNHAEVEALRRAGERARGATLYVTLEPCSHHGRTPPCTDAIAAAGVTRVVIAALDPTDKVDGVRALRRAGIAVDVHELPEAHALNEAWMTWATKGRPFVTLKLAASLDGRVTIPGRRWVSGEASRRRVHELRARSDAVAVGMGTVRADAPRLDARDVEVVRQPRRLAFGRGPLPEGSELELRSGPVRQELEKLAAEGVQSLLLEGGPTLAGSFVKDGFVDRVVVFVAPVLAGGGRAALGAIPLPVDLGPLRAEQCGDDVILTADARREG
ncbi:MAG: bifunctional diaminohydroxyphosphoribosylaminopyrimidine deaminase/5-amino-6-(5-phosphoribosylamino)uracil reductase RibD [Gaiellales bacterium]